MTTTRDIDRITAEKFLFRHRHNAGKLIDKYGGELDAEIRDDMVKLGNYLKLRLDGVKPVWAKMSACRRAAAMNCSDRDFNRAERRKMEDMNPYYRRSIMAIAKRAGIDTSGKFYVGALGRYDDPGAWVSTVDDVRTTARKKKMAFEGLVNCDYTEDQPVTRCRLAPDLVEEQAQQELAENPALAEKARRKPSVLQEVRRTVVEKYGARA